MNSNIERQTLTTRYLGGRGEGLLRLLCRGVSNSGRCRFSNSSFHCVKLIFFCEKGLLLGLSKGDARVEIPASFVLAFNCKLQSSP